MCPPKRNDDLVEKKKEMDIANNPEALEAQNNVQNVEINNHLQWVVNTVVESLLNMNNTNNITE